MIIAVDEALPFRDDAFSKLGEMRLFSGRGVTRDQIRDVDALIVRTITPVNASLLDGTSVRFVGAASAGNDHVDLDYLRRSNIHFSYSAGCNANSVSEYVFTALYHVAARRNWDLERKSLAVIGVGNVGSRVARKARALGMEVLLCDPPLRDLTGDSSYRPMEEVLGADILTFHVPLSCGGPYPTVNMVDADILRRLSPESYIINCSRGPVIDGFALKTALRERRVSGAILDVWDPEPAIDYALVDVADIATPHIAGTSMNGKIQATEMVREELCSYFGIGSMKIADAVPVEPARLRPAPGTAGQEAILSVLLQAFDIVRADADLRALKTLAAEEAAAGFDRLRKLFPLRPEFPSFVVELNRKHSELAGDFKALGFQVSTEVS